MPGALPSWLLPGTPPKKKKTKRVNNDQAADLRKHSSMTLAAEPLSCQVAGQHLAGCGTEGLDECPTCAVPKLALGQQLKQPSTEARDAQATVTRDLSVHKGSSTAAPPVGRQAQLLESKVIQAVSLRQPSKKVKHSAKHVKHSKAVLHGAVLPYKLVKPAAGTATQPMAAVAMQSFGQNKDFAVLMKHQLVQTHMGAKASKRVQLYASVKAADRCGQCATCLKRSMKKACLVVRKQMTAASLVDAGY